ncbi:MAG TPA: D-galactonate dehydratase family protein [bacterium]|nr:D-galactonate dehydratase family protein [bacterium]
MKIKEAKVFVCSPGRNFVTLRITTDEGLHGLGDATLNGREKAVATYLEEYCIPALIGKDPFRIEDIWQYFYRGVYWRRGSVTMAAISAIDMALWDIKGKALGVPVYNLIGGKSRDRILVYSHANGKTLEETVEEVHRHIASGFAAVRAQSGIPGIARTYGVPRDGQPYEPAHRGLPEETVWSTEKYLNFIPRLFRTLRDACGDEVHLLHDAHHRCTPIEAARLVKELEPNHLFWVEDAVPSELQESFRMIRAHSTTPLAVGEVFNTVYDYTTLISEQLIDYIRMPVGHGGGITHALKLAAFASFYHVRTGFHGATDLSPVAMMAALHVDTAIHNFGIQEYMPHQEIVREVFTADFRFDRGYLHVGDSPGLGVDFDEKAASRFPYIRASLPVNRKLDGTLTDW